MPISGRYTWDETEADVNMEVRLKGTPRHKVDLYISDVYVKVNFDPYLTIVDLAHPVDDIATLARFENGKLYLTLPKLTKKRWGDLEVVGLSKKELRERRQKSMDDKRKRDEVLEKEQRDKRYEEGQMTLRKQMALEEDERRHIEDLKAEEKSAAEREVYDTFRRMEAEKTKAEEVKAKRKKDAAKSTKSVSFAVEESPATPASETKEAPKPPTKSTTTVIEAKDPVADDADKVDAEVPDLETADASKPSRCGGDIFGAADVGEESEDDRSGAGAGGGGDDVGGDDDDDDDEEEEVVYVPPPRSEGTAKMGVKFTPRLFKTPMRESRQGEEEDWLAKNAQSIRKARDEGKLPHWMPDARDISERDPVWLKGKGDDFYRAKDYGSAVNAYGAAIDASPDMVACYSNRAACYLQLGQPKLAIEDCTRVLQLQRDNPGDDSTKDARTRFRASVRRGTAQCYLSKYALALEDFQEASKILPEEEGVKADVLLIQNLVECSKLKSKGDEAFLRGDLDGASSLFSQALSKNPSFVAALSNRAAVSFAKKDYHAVLADCTQAIQLLSSHSGAEPGPIPPAGTQLHTQFLVKTLVRRGTTFYQMENLDRAEKDYDEAIKLDPTNIALTKDAKRIRKMAKKARGPEVPTEAVEGAGGGGGGVAADGGEVAADGEAESSDSAPKGDTASPAAVEVVEAEDDGVETILNVD